LITIQIVRCLISYRLGFYWICFKI